MRGMTTPQNPERRPPTTLRKLHQPREYSRFLQEQCGFPKDEADRRAGVEEPGRWSFATVAFCVTAALLSVVWLASMAWS